MKHGTPINVVEILKGYIPSTCMSVLEPAVGKGALLSPLLNTRFKDLESITAIDIDQSRIDIAEGSLAHLDVDKKFESCDFLAKQFFGETFDCIVMNPPFNAKRCSFVEYDGKKLPVEVAFLKKSCDLLKDSGRLIAILPASLIAGLGQSGFRQSFLNSFTIKKVYELNRFTFPQIEGRFYLLIADKIKSNRQLSFQKPFSTKTAIIKIPKKEVLENNSRLDFSFYFSQIKMQELMEAADLDWQPLSNLLDVTRGEYSAPNIPDNVVHTTNYKAVGWDFNVNGYEAEDKVLKANDIVVKRVSRDCHNTFGLFVSNDMANFSDCILRLRPKYDVDSYMILFVLRTLYASSLGKNILVKGSGANYISMSGLKALNLPVDLHLKYSEEFNKYKKLYKDENFMATRLIEQKIHAHMFSA